MKKIQRKKSRNIPDRISNILWGKAAGRCQYKGCNELLWIDHVTKTEGNYADRGHIWDFSEKGSRGHPELSTKLKADLSNLILLCTKHHRHVDKADKEGHPVERLQEMKKRHEERIEILSSISEEMQSHILLYWAKIGENIVNISWQEAAQAMSPVRYPAENTAIELGQRNNFDYDSEESFWSNERKNLIRGYKRYVEPRLDSGDIKHLSIYAIAPQPLLIELGKLLSDIPAGDVYQRHREPEVSWKWKDDPIISDYIIYEPNEIYLTVALNLSLSATIDNSRISRVLGENVSIWTMTIEKPDYDCMKSKKQLSLFRSAFRNLLDKIKAKHGHYSEIHLFTAVPVSAAVEIGRILRPKADLTLKVYDENKINGGFKMALEIKSEEFNVDV